MSDLNDFRISTSAVGVTVSTASVQEAGPGSTPRAALHSLKVQPIPVSVAKRVVEPNHYLHSLPGGVQLCFGVFYEARLAGAVVFGSGPTLAYRLVKDARPGDCMTLTRLWLSDELPSNSESRVVAICLRSLRKHTSIKFVISYADPSVGHVGTIYQAGGWLYIGLSSSMPLYDIGDGKPRHSRSLSHSFGSHSTRYFKSHGVDVKLVPQAQKHRYIYFVDSSWKNRLKVPILPYPKKLEGGYGESR